MADGYEYACANDDCPRQGKVVELGSEAGDATCSMCGWFMSAVYGNDE